MSKLYRLLCFFFVRVFCFSLLIEILIKNSLCFFEPLIIPTYYFAHAWQVSTVSIKVFKHVSLVHFKKPHFKGPVRNLHTALHLSCFEKSLYSIMVNLFDSSLFVICSFLNRPHSSC